MSQPLGETLREQLGFTPFLHQGPCGFLVLHLLLGDDGNKSVCRQRNRAAVCEEELLNPREVPDSCQLPGCFARRVFVQAALTGRQEEHLPTACAPGSWASSSQGCSGIF